MILEDGGTSGPRGWQGKAGVDPEALPMGSGVESTPSVGAPRVPPHVALSPTGSTPRPQGPVHLPGMAGHLCGQLAGIRALLVLLGTLSWPRLPGGHCKCCVCGLGTGLCPLAALDAGAPGPRDTFLPRSRAHKACGFLGGICKAASDWVWRMGVQGRTGETWGWLQGLRREREAGGRADSRNVWEGGCLAGRLGWAAGLTGLGWRPPCVGLTGRDRDPCVVSSLARMEPPT